ncbi:MAG: cell division protein FtsA [Rikenellaceae bacterium]
MNNYTIAIDLGESSVIAIAGCKGDDKELHIAAVAKRETRGVKAGRIENIAQVMEALSSVIAELEKRLNVKIQQAYGGISGEYIRNERHSEMVAVVEPNNGVSTVDVGALHNLMRNVLPPDADSILEYTPQNYVVDNKQEERSPVGTFGHTLSSTFNFILCENEALKRLGYAFKQSGINLKRCFPNAVTAAEAVLTADEMEAGVAVVDLGEGMTNVTIFYRGTLRYIASIPMGGSALNSDIRSLMIQEKSIESVKRKYGVAMSEHADAGSITVEGRTSRETRSIPLHNLAVAIQERLTDITIFVHREIRDAGFNHRLPYGVVLTGGGALLRSVDDLFRRNLELEVRIGSPEEAVGKESHDLVSSPEFATVVGLLKRGVEMDSKGVGRPCTVEEESEDSDFKQKLEEQMRQSSNPKSETAEPTQTNKPKQEGEGEKVSKKESSSKDKQPKEKRRGFWESMIEKMNDLFSSDDNDTKL